MGRCKVDLLGTIFESLDLLQVDLWGERFWKVVTPGKDARRQHGQNRAARAENGAIWCKLRPKSILAEAHFGPQGSSGSWLGHDMILGSIFRANVPKCCESCSKSSLSEFTSGSRGSHGNGPWPAAQTLKFFPPVARMTEVKRTP